MILQNVKPFIKPIKIPDNFKGKVTILANCNITEDEIDLFNASLKAVSNYVLNNSIDLSDYFTLNVFFTDDGTIAFSEEKESNCGSQFHVAVYRMGKMRTLPDKYKRMLFVFIEELAHYFLRISDETIIKYRVAEILRYILPSFTDDEMKNWGLNGLESAL